MAFSFRLRKHNTFPRQFRRGAAHHSAERFRPQIEILEDRSLPSGVSFSPPVSYSTGISSTYFGGGPVAVADFDGDGKLDIAVRDKAASGAISVLLGKGDGTFQSPLITPVPPVGLSEVGLAVGEFDGDAKPDLVLTTGTFGSSVSVLLGKGDGTFQNALNVPVGRGPTRVVVGDFDRDGKQDIAVANSVDNTVSVLLGNGDGTFQAARNFAVGFGPIDLAAGDFNGDGKPDLVVLNGGSRNVSVLLGNGDGTFQVVQEPTDVGGLFYNSDDSIAVGDFNGDGKLDLATTAVVNPFGNPMFVAAVRLGNGDGTFLPPVVVDPNLLSSDLVVADFNGDGKPDLAVNGLIYNTPALDVLLGNGDGTFQTTQFPGGVSSGGVGDFNGDGKLDLVAANAINFGQPIGGTVSVMLNALVTTSAVSGPTSSTYGQPVTYTATVTSGGVPVTGGTVTFLKDPFTPFTGALPVNANGQATFSFVPPSVGNYTIIASYSGTTGGAGRTGFGPSKGILNLAVNPAVLSASGVNFSATAGAPFTGAVAGVTTANPFALAASLTATITWGDGTTSIGAVTVTGPLTVIGPHTYADPGTYAVTVQVSHPLGYTNTVTVNSTATVTSLGQEVTRGLTGDIGFWHNSSGQALINSFNDGPNSTALSTWLATSFGNLYGFMNGYTNAGVAAYYLYLFNLPGSNSQAQQVNVLATALNVYATTQSLGGTAGQAYGFTVTATGLGADSFNVGADGAAFGVTNKTTLNVYELLQAVNRLSSSYDTKLWNQVADLLSALNQAGRIS
jgi:hypothetical protein